MKVLVTGANGQLGTDLCKVLRDFELIPLTDKDIEISDISSVKQGFSKYKPDIIINTAAFVRVDDCEDEKDKALRATVDWYLKNESWWRSIKSGEYAKYYERMYSHR